MFISLTLALNNSAIRIRKDLILTYTEIVAQHLIDRHGNCVSILCSIPSIDKDYDTREKTQSLTRTYLVLGTLTEIDLLLT